MSLKEYPYLQQIHEELTRLTVAETAREPSRMRIESGRDIHRVTWPGLGAYWLTGPQVAVVRELLQALLHSRSPEVDQHHLILASGLPVRRLAEVFAGSSAWVELVVPGAGAGRYRLAAAVDDGPDDAA